MQSTRPPLYRLLVIDREIRSGRHPNAVSLAKLLEVSARTIQRDLEFLRDSLEAPLEFLPAANGYHYAEPTFVLPVQQVTEGELLAVLVADMALSEYHGTPFEGTLRGIFDKLTLALPEEVAVSPEELSRAYSFRWTAPVRGDATTFRALQDAIRDSATLEVVYHTQSRNETKRRKLDPYHLANVDGEWYLLAHCHNHDEVRVFRPSRIKQLKRTGARFRVSAGFDPSRFLQTKFHAMGGDAPVSIRVRFGAALAGYVAERDWGPAHRVQFLTDGGCELHIVTENSDAVVRWTLGWGPGAEILSPPWVRRRARDMLKQLASRYESRARRGHAG